MNKHFKVQLPFNYSITGTRHVCCGAHLMISSAAGMTVHSGGTPLLAIWSATRWEHKGVKRAQQKSQSTAIYPSSSIYIAHAITAPPPPPRRPLPPAPTPKHQPRHYWSLRMPHRTHAVAQWGTHDSGRTKNEHAHTLEHVYTYSPM